jgi:hypothetical protein
VLGFTTSQRDIVFDGVTYVAMTAYDASDVASASDLAVDNLEVAGMLRSPFITEADMDAGLWDFARIKISRVNYMDLSMGEHILRVGTLGEVSVDRHRFKAEFRGMLQPLTTVIGELTSPSCRAVLGDARCKVDLYNFTVSGTLTGVGADNRTMRDSARTEPGPSAGIAITGITRANPGVVTLASDLGEPSGTPIIISDVVGMEEVNTTTIALSVSGNQFNLPVDTTAFDAYVSGGHVRPLGSGSGYFDNGVMTFTSGANAGISMEVQSYVPGQWTLLLPLPYTAAIGDEYTMHAGCDYSLATCRDRFDNIVNMRAEPYLPGVDKLMQVGKQS